jgi:hypothetical protein
VTRSEREFENGRIIMPDSVETKKRSSKPDAKVRGKHAVLRAKPLKGEVDHEALSREFIARFPKLRAVLAK